MYIPSRIGVRSLTRSSLQEELSEEFRWNIFGLYASGLQKALW